MSACLLCVALRLAWCPVYFISFVTCAGTLDLVPILANDQRSRAPAAGGEGTEPSMHKHSTIISAGSVLQVETRFDSCYFSKKLLIGAATAHPPVAHKCNLNEFLLQTHQKMITLS